MQRAIGQSETRQRHQNSRRTSKRFSIALARSGPQRQRSPTRPNWRPRSNGRSRAPSRSARSSSVSYSFHAPEVECIGKGKASAPYEFGVKDSTVTTNACAGGGQFVLHAKALPGNPYEHHTLAAVHRCHRDAHRLRDRARLCRHGLPRPQHGQSAPRLRLRSEARRLRDIIALKPRP